MVKQQAVEHAITFLQELPEKPKEDLSLKEAVESLRDSIRSALAKGYSYQDLAGLLTEKGIKISALTLKNYVPAGKRQTAKMKGRQPRKVQSDELTSSEPTDALPETTTNTEAPVAKPVETEAPPAKPRRGRAKGAIATKANKPAAKTSTGQRKRTSA